MKIIDNIKEILKKGNIQDNMYFLPKIKLDRNEYIECDSILQAIGFKWCKRKKAHIPTTEEIENLEETLNYIIENGEVETLKEYKKKFQFYQTPKKIAEYLVKLAEIKENDEILEPSAGDGAILKAILEKYPKKDFQNMTVYANEINKDMCLLLKDIIQKVSQDDFMNFEHMKFDKIIMNPPFNKKQDYNHIKKAIALLNNGGRIVGIMSKGVLFREDYRDLKEEIEKHGYIEELEEGTFKESGAMVGTCIIVYDK